MSGTLEEALDSATDELTSEETEESTAEEESQEDQTTEAESTEEESDEESQTDESTDESDEDTTEEDTEEGDESFTKVDPNSLPEEVKPVYKSLLADYTRKRQQEAEQVRTMQAENEQLKQQLAEAQQGGQGRPQGNPGQVQIDLTPEQIGDMTLPEYTQYVIGKALETTQATQQTREVQNFEQEAVTGFLSMDARLNPDVESSYDPKFATFVGNAVDQDYEEHIQKTGSPVGFDYKGSAQKHIQEWDDWVNSIKKESVQKTSKESKAKANRHRKSSPPTSKARSKKSGKMDLGGAIDAAFDEAL